jgi:hypothetical protein
MATITEQYFNIVSSARSSIEPSSASPAIPATACRSPAISSPAPPRLFGNDLATFPDYPAEIRAPAGTLPGVSGFQIQFSSSDVYTPGDSVDVLIAMNPAALKMNIKDLRKNGILIVNSDSFAEAT